MQSIDIATAREFFLQLEKFSRRIRQLSFGKENASPWGHELFKSTVPNGCIIHYTASCDVKSTVKWFCDISEKSNASAHVIIARDNPDWAASIAKAFPLIATLPTLVVQCRSPQQTAWHATWTNDTTYGIELMNAGEIRGEKGNYVWWPNNFKQAYPHTAPPIEAAGKMWEGWPKEQLLTCAMVAMYANAYHGRPFKPHMLLGHENVQGLKTVHGGGHDKRDLGPLFPLKEMREGILTHDLTSLAFGDVTVDAMHARIADIARLTAKTASSDNSQAIAAFWEQVADLPSASNRTALSVGILAVLGYATDGSMNFAADGLNARSLGIFQRLMGLEPDEVLGPATVAALRDRVFDRWNKVVPTAKRSLT